MPRSEASRAAAREYNKKWALDHKEELKAYGRQYYLDHRENQIAAAAQRREAKRAQLNAEQREYYAKHRERELANRVKYRAANQDKIIAGRRSGPGRFSAWRGHIKRKYGLTVEQHQALMLTQDGQCAFRGCDRYPRDVDHDHKTGKVRGLLCHDHNVALGGLHDSAEDAEAAIDYLRSRVIKTDP